MSEISGRPLSKLGFLTIGTFDESDPFTGHENTLQLIEFGEQLGFDSAWLRNRHLQYGISSPVAVLAAASQRTNYIELGTAVTPLGFENPFRLAEDLATVDVLSHGRLNPGISTGTPTHFDDVKGALYPDSSDSENFGYERATRLLAALRGDTVSTFEGTEGIEAYSPIIQPHSPGLIDRVWYGAGSLASAAWAGDQGLSLLSSSVVRAEDDDDFARIQRAQIDLFRAKHPLGASARASQGLVVIPTDSATSEQSAKYHAYAESRFARTLIPQGPARMLFAPDLVGPSAAIAETLQAHAGYQAVDEVVFALPFTFGQSDYLQILTDIAGTLGPLLGWSPQSR
ncbi:LLM class flavin-dependent oxidoreductase [Subtercola sp. PAMC28395]|uniref:LLM class flavin-dependent oxidoreductase n=1 Tax=Subtercola sp. PAMC28395 TaxID=2846775 RepID=UPI001C0E7FB4|nr:LLM class flavin-dependent oxidoreductase [Subtercola sp. PAMC28395]QWT22682.1 LLM class flavin-dependent oxidoreductase [Subtercola sp. PAMC28395]